MITPHIPVWAGSAPATFGPARAANDRESGTKAGEPSTYATGPDDAPLPRSDKPLHFDPKAGMRVR